MDSENLLNDKENIVSVIDRFKMLHTILSQNNYINDTTNKLTRVVADATSNTQILFIGKERVGKSTIINALLSRDLLHSSEQFPTNFTTFIKYGEEEKLEIVFLDGFKASFPLSKYQSLLNSDSELSEIINGYVDYMNLYVKHELLKQVTLIDTKAIEITENQSAYFSENLLARVDEVFWLIHPNTPMSEEELQLLKKISLQFSKPYIITNAIDTSKNVAAFIKDEKARYGQYIEQLIQVSAKLAVDARKTNNMQALIDSNYTSLVQVISGLAANKEKKVTHTYNQLEQWLVRFNREIEGIQKREPYISAYEKIKKHIAENELEFNREKRDLAIIKTYEEDYAQAASTFKSVQTLYQLLQVLGKELFLRDEKTESFEENATLYQQQVRNYRNALSEYEAHYAQIQGFVKAAEEEQDYTTISFTNKANVQQLNDQLILLNDKQTVLQSLWDLLKKSEAKVLPEIYDIQNHLIALVETRLKALSNKVVELNAQRKNDYEAIISYSNKLEEFSCISEGQLFIKDAIKPFFESEIEGFEETRRNQVLQTIELITAVQLDHLDLGDQLVIDDNLTTPIEVNFEDAYKLAPLHLTEKDIVSDIPVLPKKLRVKA